MYSVYDCMYGNFPAKINVYTPYICMVLANPAHVCYHGMSSNLLQAGIVFDRD
jgi:hypothetical protein